MPYDASIFSYLGTSSDRGIRYGIIFVVYLEQFSVKMLGWIFGQLKLYDIDPHVGLGFNIDIAAHTGKSFLKYSLAL